MSTARRVYFYLVTLITLGIFAVGIGQLLSLIFDITIKGAYLAQVGETAFNQQQLSLGLAMLVIGGPLWFFFWRSVQRRVAGNAEEIGAGIRKLFLNFILLETAFMALTGASDFLAWLFGGAHPGDFTASVLASTIVAGSVWFYHWHISEAEGHPSAPAKTLRRWYVYILAGFGLVWLATGLVQLVNAAISSLPFGGSTIVAGDFWSSFTQLSVAWIILGGLSWYFHWFRMARGDFDSTLRQVYFYLLAIFGGAVAALVALTFTIFRIFSWIFGGTPVPSGQGFQFLGWTIPTMLVGAAIWAYHQWLAQEEAARAHERSLSAQRVYLYLMSFLGLGTMVTGLILLIGVLLDLLGNAISPPVVVSPGWWQNQLSLCLALLFVGTPLWLYYWGKVLRRAATGGISEWRARSRRIFLYFVVGASIIAVAASLVNIVYQILNGILQGSSGVSVLHNAKWSLQALVVAAPLLWYHWQILRLDQHRGAEAAAVQKSVAILAGGQVGDLAPRLEEKLGYRIRVLNRVGQPGGEPIFLSDDELAGLVTEIQQAPSDRVILLALGGKISVLPYQEK